MSRRESATCAQCLFLLSCSLTFSIIGFILWFASAQICVRTFSQPPKVAALEFWCRSLWLSTLSELQASNRRFDTKLHLRTSWLNILRMTWFSSSIIYSDWLNTMGKTHCGTPVGNWNLPTAHTIWAFEARDTSILCWFILLIHFGTCQYSTLNFMYLCEPNGFVLSPTAALFHSLLRYNAL